MKNYLGFYWPDLSWRLRKVEKYSNDFGSATFLNVVPFSPPAAGFLAVTMRVYEDTLMRTASGISYRGTSGYLAFAPGTKTIQLRSSADLTTVLLKPPISHSNSIKRLHTWCMIQ